MQGCRTSFIIPSELIETQHHMSCQEAQKFLEKIHEYSYVKKMNIIRSERLFFPAKDRYELVSIAQAQCLLKCASAQTDQKTYKVCKNSCLTGLVEYVLLTPKDSLLYGKIAD